MNANPERGEVKFTLNGEDGVLCAEMAKLAVLSGSIGTKSLSELIERISGLEPLTMFAVIDALTVKGDVKSLKEMLKGPADFKIISEAAMTSLSAFMETSGKKNGDETGNR